FCIRLARTRAVVKSRNTRTSCRQCTHAAVAPIDMDQYAVYGCTLRRVRSYGTGIVVVRQTESVAVVKTCWPDDLWSIRLRMNLWGFWRSVERRRGLDYR